MVLILLRFRYPILIINIKNNLIPLWVKGCLLKLLEKEEYFCAGINHPGLSKGRKKFIANLYQIPVGLL
jgi:hypothetical protein